MLVNPSALKRAQEEIDRVIGPDRLPTPADRPMLPYIDALAKEALRWQVVAPLGECSCFLHRTSFVCLLPLIAIARIPALLHRRGYLYGL